VTGPASLWAFQGEWTLDRTITHADGHRDRMTGSARFHASGARLVQDETGWLEANGARLQATRRYIWAETDGRLDVYFSDMRPFHTIPLGAEAPETVHLCPPDLYQVAYDFADWPVWRTVWQVDGPRKAYRMQSTFHPAGDAALLARRGAAVHKVGKD
jgi:hypothetical protein